MDKYLDLELLNTNVALLSSFVSALKIEKHFAGELETREIIEIAQTRTQLKTAKIVT